MNRYLLIIVKFMFFIISIFTFSGCDENVHIDFYEPCIYMMDADGSDLTRVIDIGATYALFIPNRTKILYRSGTSLYTVNFNGTDIKMITDTLVVKSEYPSISTDGTKVIFVSNDDLYIVNIDGSEMVRLTNTKDIIERQPFISIDNIEMIYTTRITTLKEKASYNICRKKLNNEIIDTFVTSGAYLGWPSYSPDGVTIYYTRGGSNEGLYSMNKDGSNTIKLVSEISAGYPTSISLNKLIYIYYPNIYIMNNDGSEIQELGKGYEPHIAPFNDSKIVYSNNGFYDGDIYIMNNDGTEKRKIANYGYNARFSNDGNKIVFPGQYQINKSNKNYITN